MPTTEETVTESNEVEQSRLWLMYPPRLIKNPVIWEVGTKFDLVPNVRQASVTDEIGIVCLELSGLRENIKAAVKWMEELGVSVEPVEINVIES
ncbi:NIL domain-containing protein [bacterium]|jgi:L-aspartate semialdehyde sulfurtransferase ferredoxin|nr:NIL domain-containing protein [bacterium]